MQYNNTTERSATKSMGEGARALRKQWDPRKKGWVRTDPYREDSWKNPPRKPFTKVFMYINGHDLSPVWCKSIQSPTYEWRRDNSICTPQRCSLSLPSPCADWSKVCTAPVLEQRSVQHEWEGVLSQDGRSSGGLARKINLTQDRGGSLVSARRKVHKLEKQMCEERGWPAHRLYNY